jgi:predicted transcriptional regulator
MSVPRDRDRDDGRTSLPPGTLLRAALEVLWNSNQSSIRDVVDGLESKLGSDVPYSTVASVLNKLCDTGFATRVRIPGAREYFYSALVSRDQMERTLTMEAVQTILTGARDSREALSYLVDIVGKADRRFLEGLGEVVDRRRQVVKAKRERADSRSKKR